MRHRQKGADALPFRMAKQIKIASITFLRRWRRVHRKLTGSTARKRHVYMAKALALAGMTPEQVAVVTAHHAHVEQAFCCDFVAEHVAAMLRPHLFADSLTASFEVTV